MKQYIARQSSTDQIFLLATKDDGDPFELFARVILKLDTSAKEFETENVDIDLEEIAPMECGTVREVLAEPKG